MAANFVKFLSSDLGCLEPKQELAYFFMNLLLKNNIKTSYCVSIHERVFTVDHNVTEDLHDSRKKN